MKEKLAHVLLRLLGSIPLSIRRQMGFLLGGMIGLIPNREKTTATLQLQKFLPNVNAEKCAREVFSHIGTTIFESINLHPILHHQSQSIECPDQDYIQELLRSPEPTIALTAHTGNWELMAAYMSTLGVPVVTIGRRARSQMLQAILEELRSRSHVQTIWRAGVSGQKEIVRTLKDNGVLAVLIDQDTQVNGIPSEFFGSYVTTPSSLIELGLRHNARFVTALNFRLPNNRYLIRVEPLKVAQNVESLVSLYNKRLEQYIRKYPSQWVWFHKRWRTRKDGSRLSTRDYQKRLENGFT